MPIDYKRYPPNWKSEIVPSILLRANNKCECCGLENKSIVFSIKIWIKENGRYKYTSVWFRNEDDAIREKRDSGVKQSKVILTIAHLDHDETNWDVKIDRLKAMCQACHCRYDAAEKYRRSLINWKKGID